jgi:hypothetical protein
MIYRAYVNDMGSPSYDFNHAYFEDMADWAKEHCGSFISFEIADVSDVSLIYDEVAEFCFGNEQDLLMFKLKYPCDD